MGGIALKMDQQRPLVFEPLGFYGFLDSMQRNMPMFLGRYSLELLDTFLNGSRFIKMHQNITLDEEEDEFGEFQEFVRKKYRRTDMRRWSSWIILRCDGDGEEAVNEFYRLFDEFREKKRKEKARQKKGK